MIKNIIQLSILLSLLTSCLKPYEVDTSGYEKLLVVDATITNDNPFPTVTISLSKSDILATKEMVSNAFVSISDSQGMQVVFEEVSSGVYQPLDEKFQAQIGSVYQLYIRTIDGKEYASDPCEMLPPSQLDKVYIGKDAEWDVESTQQNQGISIFVDGQSNGSNYLKWTYEENWKFKIPYPNNFTFDIVEDEPVLIPAENIICWKNHSSYDITIHSTDSQSDHIIQGKKIRFIPTRLSDRLSMRYSIDIRQMTISKVDYNFWSNLKKSTEDVGELFGKQPFSIQGNLHSINNPKEPVLGYFQVGSVVSQKIYINDTDVKALGVKNYQHTDFCQLDTYIVDGEIYLTLNDIYTKVILNGPYDGIHSLVDVGSQTVGFTMARPECADCSITGSTSPPSEWIE